MNLQFQTYSLIQDAGILQNFVDSLPDDTPSEKYYIALLARRKYFSEIPSDRAQLKRVLANKKDIVDKIRQLETKVGCYKVGDKEIPEIALALYIMPNPRDLNRATRNSLIKFAELIANDAEGFNPVQEVMSQVQKARSRGVFLDFDFDCETQPDLTGILNKDSYRTLKTRGGYHILVELDKIADEFRKTFHQAIKKLGPDVTGDCLIPVPGCIQGGFSPYFV